MNDQPDRSLSDADLATWVRRHPEVWHFADDSPEAETPEQLDTLIELIVSGEHERRRGQATRRRRTRLTIGGACAALVLVGGAVGVAAIVRSGQPAAPETGVLCRATARLDADAIGIAPGSDPIAGCAQRWADGLLGDPGQPVPLLTACVSNNGSIDVFPGDATVCETLGLIAADDELTPDNAAIVALQDRLANEINAVECQPVQAAAAAAQEILAQSGFDGWKVAIAADAQAGTCGKAGVDSAARTVTIIEFKAP